MYNSSTVVTDSSILLHTTETTQRIPQTSDDSAVVLHAINNPPMYPSKNAFVELKKWTSVKPLPAGIKFASPKAGVYVLRFTSECSELKCVDAVYPILEDDALQIRVVPGTPYAMNFLTEPPVVNENDFYLDPAPSIEVRDVVGRCRLTPG